MSALLGTWWRCEDHGLTQDPIFVGDYAYCPAGECVLRVALVKGAIRELRDRSRTEWRRSSDLPAPKATRPKKPAKRGRRPRGLSKGSVASIALEILQGAGPGGMQWADLLPAIQARRETTNSSVSSALGYLKRTGRALNPSRGLWRAP